MTWQADANTGDCPGMPDEPHYEILALRYATLQERPVSENFLLPHDDHGSPMPIDYFIWLIRGAGRIFVVDTGFGALRGARRGRVLLRTPADALAEAGVIAADVRDVVLTHLHYDHAGGLDAFPAAMFHLQDAEMAFVTGRCMCHRAMRVPFDLEDVLEAVTRVYAGRVRFHAGTAHLAPGISLHLVGGHSGGMQVVRVHTARGWVVLASDASHYWANIRTGNPFPLAVSVSDMAEGWRLCEELSDGPDHIIPGHDPLVRTRFPAARGMTDTVRVDLPPVN